MTKSTRYTRCTNPSRRRASESEASQTTQGSRPGGRLRRRWLWRGIRERQIACCGGLARRSATGFSRMPKSDEVLTRVIAMCCFHPAFQHTSSAKTYLTERQGFQRFIWCASQLLKRLRRVWGIKERHWLRRLIGTGQCLSQSGTR